jgi:hypothetical protein
MRERKYNVNEQSSFAKNHSVLVRKCLLTDVDAIQKTENEFYNEYWYKDGNPVLRRFIEVKFKPTDYIKRQISRQDELNSQTKIFIF